MKNVMSEVIYKRRNMGTDEVRICHILLSNAVKNI